MRCPKSGGDADAAELNGPGSAVAGLPGSQDLPGVFYRDRVVAPACGYAIHDVMMNDAGLALMTRMMSVAAAPGGAPVARLEPGTSLEL
jgi:hypothetical protein